MMRNKARCYRVGRQSAIERTCLSESTWVEEAMVAEVDMMTVVATAVVEEEVAMNVTKLTSAPQGRLFVP